MSSIRVARRYLYVQGSIWVCYGLLCFCKPSLLDTLAGLGGGWAAEAEIVSMYGGAQFSIGLFGLLCSRGTDAEARSGVLLNACLMLGLAISRAMAVVRAGKPLMPRVATSLEGLTDGSLFPEAYNADGVWMYELPAGLLALWIYLALKPASLTKQQ